MTRQKRLNIILVSVAVLCPVLFYIGCMTAFMSEGCRSELAGHFWMFAGVAIVISAGPLGFTAALTLLIMNRRKRSIFRRLGLFALLLLNFYFILPVYLFFGAYCHFELLSWIFTLFQG